ncbi:MAG: hypothetical protein M3450_04310 [Actinomycetota bacterium]|nr:hypothetical protein [Actinomycetota bacterium]
MGRARRLGGGTRGTGLAIEYVRKRKIVRLLGWLDDEAIAPVEIPVAELCTTLGIDPRDLGVPRQYLLFAGSYSRPAGGLRDLAGTFDVEERAWEAFRELRQAHPATQSWAELATIDGLGHVTQMAWFGLHPASEPGERPPSAGDVPVRSRIRGLHRPVRKTGSTSYLRAVTPS